MIGVRAVDHDESVAVSLDGYTGPLDWRYCFDCGAELMLHPGEDCPFCDGWTYADDLYFAVWSDGEPVFTITSSERM
jgi:hypothetical protein